MKSTPTPHVATGVTLGALVVTFGATGSHFKHEVEVPAGTRCRKLEGGSEPWVVSDLGFIADKKGVMYSDASIYGIRIPDSEITDIQPVSKR